MSYQQLYNKVSKLVKEQNRKCDICGVSETMDNLIIKYDNGLYLCDECMLSYYKDFPIE